MTPWSIRLISTPAGDLGVFFGIRMGKYVLRQSAAHGLSQASASGEDSYGAECAGLRFRRGRARWGHRFGRLGRYGAFECRLLTAEPAEGPRGGGGGRFSARCHPG